jgi:hypothetical protein
MIQRNLLFVGQRNSMLPGHLSGDSHRGSPGKNTLVRRNGKRLGAAHAEVVAILETAAGPDRIRPYLTMPGDKTFLTQSDMRRAVYP